MAKPTTPSDFHYRHEGPFTQTFLGEKLWPGHFRAWQMVTSAIYMLDAPLTSEASDVFHSFFGKEATGSNFGFIKSTFKELQSNLFDEFSYIAETKDGAGNDYCDKKCKKKAQTATKFLGSTYHIWLCVDAITKYKVTEMAGLLLHEHIHRNGEEWKVEDIAHFKLLRNLHRLKDFAIQTSATASSRLAGMEEDRFIAAALCDNLLSFTIAKGLEDGTIALYGYQNDIPTKKLLKNCDSYACLSAWAFLKGYLTK